MSLRSINSAGLVLSEGYIIQQMPQAIETSENINETAGEARSLKNTVTD